MRLTRKPLLIGAGVVLAGVGAGAYVLVTRADPAVRYRTAAATLGTVTQTVSLSGNLAPVGETDLNFSGSGRVSAVDVQVGQQVTAGQVLATLDASTLQNQLTIAQANLSSAQAKLSLDQAGPSAQSVASAQAQVNSANVTLQNDQTAYNDTVAVNAQQVQQAQSAYNAQPTQQNYDAWQAAITKAQQADDQASGQVSMAKVQLQNAQAALSALDQGTTQQQLQMDQSQVQVDQVNVQSAQTAVNDATLTATADGVVAAVNISDGESVGGSGGGSSSSASSASSGSPAVAIITPGAFEVTGSVSDALVNEIALAQKAQVIVAGSSEALTGSVTSIAQEATISSGVATFPVTVTLDGSDPSLRDGMSASVNVIVNQVVQVLTVPTSAVHTLGGASTVQVLVNGQAQTRAVTVGASDALRTQIVSGLNAGDEVIIATVSASVPTNSSGGGLFGGGFAGGGGRGGGGGGRVAGPGG